MPYNELTQLEKDIILHKKTEPAFSGKFWDHKGKGIYTCRQCNAKLFHSNAKFDSGTGWPSFDEAIDGAITEKLDDDQRRTEIVCSNCGGHLGHVFRGECFTYKNTRYCVNSASLDFE
jgi:methionine-R-sulfoxide reductase